jgi:hypothetical protein
MKNLGKIAGINIAIIVVYGILLRVSGTDSWNVVLVSMMLVIFQVLINFALALMYYGNSEKSTGHSYMLTSLFVLIVGFGVCVAPVPNHYRTNYYPPVDTIHLPSSSHDTVQIKADTTVPSKKDSAL